MSTPYDNWASNPNETHGPLMSIAVWSLTGVSAGFLLLRLCIRQHQGKLWLDDLVLGISWVSDYIPYQCSITNKIQALLLSQAIINQLTIDLGFGKHSLDSK